MVKVRNSKNKLNQLIDPNGAHAWWRARRGKVGDVRGGGRAVGGIRVRGGGTPGFGGARRRERRGGSEGIRPGLRTGGRGAARVCRLELSPARRGSARPGRVEEMSSAAERGDDLDLGYYLGFGLGLGYII